MEVTPHTETSWADAAAQHVIWLWFMEKCEIHSTALGWPSSTAMGTNIGLEVEASSNSGNACVSSQAGLPQTLPHFLLPCSILSVKEKDQHRKEEDAQVCTSWMSSSPENFECVDQESSPYTSLLAQWGPTGLSKAGNLWCQMQYSHLRSGTYDLRRLQPREIGQKGGDRESDAHTVTAWYQNLQRLSFLPLRSGEGKYRVTFLRLCFTGDFLETNILYERPIKFLQYHFEKTPNWGPYIAKGLKNPTEKRKQSFGKNFLSLVLLIFLAFF